jgi:outer membrane protein assembly factor BamB/TolB-like protein
MLIIPLVLLLTIPRVAVLDFENLTRDRSLDWLSAGIAETLTTELWHSRNFRLVERRRLGDVIQEIKLNRSGFIDAATAQRMGKLAGADTILVGSFQKAGEQLRITARLVDVETGVPRATATIEGLYKNIFVLESDLASRLAGAALAPAPRLIPMEAFQAFSSGVYYLHHDVIDDAIANFNRALQMAPDYTEAQFYKGVALQKRGRLDEAIALFKRALPSAPAGRRVTWSWQVPFKAEPANRTVIVADDRNEFSLQRDMLFPEARLRREKRVIYAERNGNSVVLHIADPEHHAARRVELPDDRLALPNRAFATDRLTIIRSQESWYGIGADASVWWHRNLPAETVLLGVASNAIYTFVPSERRLAVFDDRTFQSRWERQNLAIDRLEPLKTRKTAANGNIVIARTDAGIHAMRLADGKDAWIFETPDARFSHIVTDRFAIALEWDRRVSVIDIETGKSVLDLPVPQFADAVNAKGFGAPMVASAAVQGSTFYFLSRTKELYAVRLGESSASLLWHTPAERFIESIREADGRLYLASPETGKLLVLDAATGATVAVVPIASGLHIDEASTSIVIGRAEAMVYGIDPVTGTTRWEYPAGISRKDITVVKGVVMARTSETHISALDRDTGALLWQYSGTRQPGMFLTDRSLFVIEDNGLKEYAIDQAPQSITSVSSQEVLAELAGALAAKGNLQDATAFLEKARQFDPDYPPVRLLRSRLLHDGRELAAYAGLVGTDSQAGQLAEAELERDYGLLWHQTPQKSVSAFSGKPLMVAGRLITAGSALGRREVMAINPKTGEIIWRQPSERFSGVAVDGATGRLWHVSGDEQDQKAVVLYSLSIANGERKELARFRRPLAVMSASVSFVRGRICVLTVSPDLASKSQQIVVDCFTPEGERLSSEPHRVPEGTFLTYVPPAVEAVEGHPLLWPASSVLVDGNAIYAFTPDGGAYKQRRE